MPPPPIAVADNTRVVVIDRTSLQIPPDNTDKFDDIGSLSSMHPMVDVLIKALREKKDDKGKPYVVYENGDLNIVGVRTVHKGPEGEIRRNVSNAFDDHIYVFYKGSGNNWKYHDFKATTDPSAWHTQVGTSKNRKTFLNFNGVAILPHGQYVDKYELGLHNSAHPALRPTVGNGVPAHRDSNKDSTFEFTSLVSRHWGINIHRACINKESDNYEDGVTKDVDGWSAGCQVFADVNKYQIFMKLIYEKCGTKNEDPNVITGDTHVIKRIDVNEKTFTYTLLKTSDICLKCLNSVKEDIVAADKAAEPGKKKAEDAAAATQDDKLAYAEIKGFVIDGSLRA